MKRSCGSKESVKDAELFAVATVESNDLGDQAVAIS